MIHRDCALIIDTESGVMRHDPFCDNRAHGDYRHPGGLPLGCPCESSFCDHEPARCLRASEGDKIGSDPIMLYLGPCCGECARRMVESGGAEYVMVPIGTCEEYIG